MNGRIVAFWSPGSPGVTTIAANCAALLGQWADRRTVAVDFNLTSPGLALNLGLFSRHTPLSLCLSTLLPGLISGSLTPEALADSLPSVPESPGLRVMAGLFRPLALEQIDAVRVEQLLDYLAQQFDLVLVDLPSPIDYSTTYITLEKADQAFWLVSGQVGDRFHLRRYLSQDEALGLNHRERAIVLNCPGPATARQVEFELNQPVKAEVPWCPSLPSLLEQGLIPVLADGNHQGLAPFRKGIESVARLIAPSGVGKGVIKCRA